MLLAASSVLHSYLLFSSVDWKKTIVRHRWAPSAKGALLTILHSVWHTCQEDCPPLLEADSCYAQGLVTKEKPYDLSYCCVEPSSNFCRVKIYQLDSDSIDSAAVFNSCSVVVFLF